MQQPRRRRQNFWRLTRHGHRGADDVCGLGIGGATERLKQRASKDVSDSGVPIWDLKLAQAQSYEKKERALTSNASEPDEMLDIANEGPRPNFDDSEIPF